MNAKTQITPPQPAFRILFNYWEGAPSQLGARLDSLKDRRVTSITSFVPWSVFEGDIHHGLLKYILAATERKFKLTLIVTPELGVHAEFSGMPRDLVTREDNLAKNADGESVQIVAGPSPFHVPSHYSPEFQRRFSAFSSRLNVFFRDLQRQHPRAAEHLTLAIGGGFFKHVRSMIDTARDPLGGECVDQSTHAQAAFRKALDETLARGELQGLRSMDHDRIHRRTFHRQSEEVFRMRTELSLKKGGVNCPIESIDVIAPDLDPSLSLGAWLARLTGGKVELKRVSEVIHQLATRAANSGERMARPWVVYSGTGSAGALSDSERQFLMLQSLIEAGGRGGALLVDEREWFSFSQSFRTRAENLSRALSRGRMRLPSRVAFLGPELWGGARGLEQEVQTQIPGQAVRLGGASTLCAATLDFRLSEVRLAILDSEWSFDSETLDRLAHWCAQGRILAIPRTHFSSARARQWIERAVSSVPKTVEMNLGTRYSVIPRGAGKIVWFDPISMSGASAKDGAEATKAFATALLSLAQVQSSLSVSDPRATAMLLEPAAGTGSARSLFVLNSSRRPLTVTLDFEQAIWISDLAPELRTEVDWEAVTEPAERASEDAGRSFEIELPPVGLLPLRVEGWTASVQDAEVAAALAEVTARAAVDAAFAELPGLESASEAGFGETLFGAES